MAQRIKKIEPNFKLLLFLYEKNKSRFTKQDIFDKWVEIIRPDKPKIDFKQFTNHTRMLAEREQDLRIQEESKSHFNSLVKKRDNSLINFEKKLNSLRMDLVEEAEGIMKINKEKTLPLKERYFVLNAVDKFWGKTQKEKEIAIKAHAEGRETVGLFSQLLKKAASGEMSLEDIEKMKVIKINNNEKEESVKE